MGGKTSDNGHWIVGKADRARKAADGTYALCCTRLLGACPVGRAQQRVGFDCVMESVLSDGEGWSCGRSWAVVAALVTEFGLEASLFFAGGVSLRWWRSQRAMLAWTEASGAC